MADLKTLKISEIRENPVALRNVQKDSEQFQGLVDSIRKSGVMNPISVRRSTDEKTNEKFYELIDGLHRFAGAREAGLTEIPVIILSMNEDQLLEAQIMTNIHKIETKPCEYSAQLRRILGRNPLMTESELAEKLAKSATWIKDRLSINKIADKKTGELIDEGRICLVNAYALAKLPPNEQADFLERAMTLPPGEFAAAANARLKELREAARKGKDATPAEFQPAAFMQKIKAIKDEMEASKVGGGLIKKVGAKSAVDGWNLALRWVMHVDPMSVEAQKAKHDAQMAEKAEAAKRREIKKAEAKKAKAEKEAKEAAVIADEVKANFEKK